MIDGVAMKIKSHIPEKLQQHAIEQFDMSHMVI